MKSLEPLISGTLYPQASLHRSAVPERLTPPEMFLREYREVGYNETTFRIIADEGPVGFLWMQQHNSLKRREAQVTFSLLASEPELLTNNGGITTSEFMGKHYGFAAYLIAIESLAEHEAVLKNGKTMTAYSVSLWKRLEEAGVVVCESEPTLLKVDYRNYPDMERPPFYRAEFRSRTLAEMAVSSTTHGLHTEVGSNF